MEQEAANWIKDLISSVGFPIFVVIWLMYRTDKILIKLTDAMHDLKECIVAVSRK